MWKNALRLFFVSLIFLVACAPKRVEMPAWEGRTFTEVLSGMDGITGMQARFSITYEKDGSEMYGEGVLELSGSGDMSLRVYSLGFLALELTYRDGIVSSSPKVDGNKTAILTRGLRDCLFWWDMKNYAFLDDASSYIIGNGERQIWFDKTTFLPLKQELYFDGGKRIVIQYGEPKKNNEIWYQSKVIIELAEHRVTLRLRDVTFRT